LIERSRIVLDFLKRFAESGMTGNMGCYPLGTLEALPTFRVEWHVFTSFLCFIYFHHTVPHANELGMNWE